MVNALTIHLNHIFNQGKKLRNRYKALFYNHKIEYIMFYNG